MLRALWLALPLALFGCSRSESPRQQRPAGASAAASAAPAASPSSVPTAPPAPLDPAFDAYHEQLARDCQLNPQPATTAEMVAHARQLERCARKRLRASLRRARVELDRREWEAFSEAACYVADAQRWTDGSMRTAGTMRRISRASCFADAAVRAAYAADLLATDRAAELARHVELARPASERAERGLLALAGSIEKQVARSYETGSYDDDCDLCNLGDADARRVRGALAFTRRESARHAGELCSAWPELSSSFASPQQCAERVAQYLLAAADQGDVDEPDAGATPVSAEERGRPPAKDADYAAFIEPLHASCDGDLWSTSSEQHTRCLEAARRRELEPRRESHGRTIAALTEQWQRFARTLCSLERVSGSWFYSESLRSEGSHDCAPLLAARGAFIAHAWAQGDAAALRRHQAARAVWATRVEAGLTQLGRVVQAQACAHDAHTGSVCRWTRLSDDTFRQATSALSSLRPHAQQLARTVCDNWPEGDAPWGEACAQQLTTLLISYAQTLGMMKQSPPQ